MLEYIYFVKCSNCEDEPFDFFDEAKEFALGCLSKKPIITQIEVNRNDFGECVDSADLGTVWSWEELMSDVPDDSETIFTKEDTFDIGLDHDPEFNSLDNTLDSVPDNFAKPVPSDMTIEALVEAMEENEDTVECKWCHELFDKSECRKEVDLGYLCDQCAAAIKSRGETLTFEECLLSEDINNDKIQSLLLDLQSYLNELATAEQTLSEVEEDDIYQDILNRINEYSFSNEMTTKFINILNVDLPLFDSISNLVNYLNSLIGSNSSLDESFDSKELVELEYDNLTTTIIGPKRSVDDRDEIEYSDSYTYGCSKEDVATAIWENFITEEDVTDVPGGLEALEDDTAWNTFLETHFDILFEKYYEKLLDYYRDDAIEAFGESSSYDDYIANQEAERADREYDAWRDEQLTEKSNSMLEELEEPDSYKKRLTMCPECGADTYDLDTGFCINCGFNTL